jgi:hypothetical protein
VLPDDFSVAASPDTTSAPAAEPARGGVDPGRALARSLLLWGAGLIWLGKPIGWLLAMIEVVWIIALVLSTGLLPTDEWITCYLLVAGFIVLWIGQAIWAYHVARRMSGRHTGAAWLLAAAPVLIVALTGFWLVAGALSTPTATFQRYVGAWQHHDTAATSILFASPELAAQQAARWTSEDDLVDKRVQSLEHDDPSLDLNADDPRSNLRFMVQSENAETATFEVEVVHDVTVPGTFLGFIPASRTETQVLAVLGHVDLARHQVTGWLAPTGAGIWQIEAVRFDGE